MNFNCAQHVHAEVAAWEELHDRIPEACRRHFACPVVSGKVADGKPFLATQLITDACEPCRLPVPWTSTAQGDVLVALNVLHSVGYLHGDIRPQNILFRRSSAPSEVHGILLDLGLARTCRLRHGAGRLVARPGHVPEGARPEALPSVAALPSLR